MHELERLLGRDNEMITARIYGTLAKASASDPVWASSVLQSLPPRGDGIALTLRRLPQLVAVSEAFQSFRDKIGCSGRCESAGEFCSIAKSRRGHKKYTKKSEIRRGEPSRQKELHLNGLDGLNWLNGIRRRENKAGPGMTKQWRSLLCLTKDNILS